MLKNENSYNSPSKNTQLTLTEQDSGSLVPITEKAHKSLYKKADRRQDMFEVLEQVYCRGYIRAKENPEEQAFNRVNSFLSWGRAWDLDQDLIEGIYSFELQEICKGKAMHRAKSKGRKKPNLMDEIWAQDIANNKYTVKRNVLSVVREAYRNK